MTEAIRLDPETGLKIFNTRAAKATDKIAGKGYSEVDDDSLTTLGQSGAVHSTSLVAEPRTARPKKRRDLDDSSK